MLAREGLLAYILFVTIPHQTVVNAEGKPVAVQIAWKDFLEIQQRLEEVQEEAPSPAWREELHSRAEEIDTGKVQLIEGEAFLEQLRAL